MPRILASHPGRHVVLATNCIGRRRIGETASCSGRDPCSTILGKAIAFKPQAHSINSRTHDGIAA